MIRRSTRVGQVFIQYVNSFHTQIVLVSKIKNYNIFFKKHVIYKMLVIFFQKVIKVNSDFSQTRTDRNDTSFDARWSSLLTVF